MWGVIMAAPQRAALSGQTSAARVAVNHVPTSTRLKRLDDAGSSQEGEIVSGVCPHSRVVTLSRAQTHRRSGRHPPQQTETGRTS